MAKTGTIRLQQPVIDQLKRLAKENFRTVGQTIAWLIHEHQINNESAQDYCEKEPLYSELLQSMENAKTGKGFKAYNSPEELFDDIS